ncbi:MAG: YqzL family protein [Firmicutes bacterium]|nr:YqzL family protein [Bacillota bacterium]
MQWCAELLWRIFASTGSVHAYLLYRQLVTQ